MFCAAGNALTCAVSAQQLSRPAYIDRSLGEFCQLQHLYVYLGCVLPAAPNLRSVAMLVVPVHPHVRLPGLAGDITSPEVITFFQAAKDPRGIAAERLLDDECNGLYHGRLTASQAAHHAKLRPDFFLFSHNSPVITQFL